MSVVRCGLDSGSSFLRKQEHIHHSGEAMEIRVVNNNVEKALRVAKKKLAADGLFRELKRRRFYEKPSVRRKAKEREAARRRQKWLAKRSFR